MEAAISLIIQGCSAAAMVESSLPELGTQIGTLLTYCDVIAKNFVVARDILGQSIQRNEDLLGAEQRLIGFQERKNEATQKPGTESTEAQGTVSGCSGGASSTSQRARKRGDGLEKRIIQVPAPRIRNTEMPPYDGQAWRKYGQKEIYRSKFPRSYFRCTHQKLYNCQAKKQVQRLDNDPYTYQITYKGDHTCHMYTTAPSAPPSIEAPATSSAAQYSGREAEDRAVIELADAMFNSGNGSTMDLIFPSNLMEEKKDK